MQTQEQSNNLNRRLAPKFLAREFMCPCCYKEGIQNEVVMRLQMTHEKLPKNYVITILAGYRCLKYNSSSELGSDESSSHPKGYAVKIKCESSRFRFHLLKALIESGFTRIGIRIDNEKPWKSFIYADCDPDKDPEVIWKI